PVLHRGDSLSSGLWESQAYRHASDDIATKKQVFSSLPEGVRSDVHRMATSSAGTCLPSAKKLVKGTHIVALAPHPAEKAKRSQPTGSPLGTSTATFRMVGTVSGGKCHEVGGTSYSNMTPPGYYNYSSETKRSHVLPSMLLSPEHRASGGNTTVTKSTFVNQSYDRGSEEAIRK